MLIGSRASTRSRFEMDRFSIDLIDYEWDRGTEVYECQPDVTLLWRVEPNKLAVPGHIGSSHVENFGQLMLLPPQIPLKSAGPTRLAGRSLVVACRFNPDWLSDLMGLSGDAMRDDLCINLNNKHIEYSMRRLWSALSMPGFADDILTEGLATTMAADLARQLIGMEQAPTSSGTLSSQQIALITEYLAEDGNWTSNVADLSSLLNLSETHFRRLFKATVGETLHGHIERLRLDRAKLLLNSTHLPLKVISHRLGFAHPSAFSAAFKRLAGLSPKAYRQACNHLKHH